MKLAAILASLLILTGCADLDPIMGRTPGTPVPAPSQERAFITVSPDGNKMFALYRHLNKVQSIDLSTGAVTKVITGFNLPTRADFTDDSLKAYVTNEGGGGSVSIVT